MRLLNLRISNISVCLFLVNPFKHINFGGIRSFSAPFFKVITIIHPKGIKRNAEQK